jgi:hypothetical protein
MHETKRKEERRADGVEMQPRRTAGAVHGVSHRLFDCVSTLLCVR